MREGKEVLCTVIKGGSCFMNVSLGRWAGDGS